MARGLGGSLCCDHLLKIAAYSYAHHHRGDHEGKGERHQDHTHLEERDFPKHPAAFPRMLSVTAGA